MCCDQCDRGYHYFCVGLEAIPAGEGKGGGRDRGRAGGGSEGVEEACTNSCCFLGQAS